MSGLLEKLDVATDTRSALINVIKITQEWNSKVTHYRTGKDIRGVPYLILMWSDNKGSMPLIAPMDNPDAIADQIYAWLKNQDYGRQPDHDGSNNKGWRVTMNGPVISEEKYSNTDHTFYDVMCIQPYWVEYHK